jgi:hypothetical protein
MKNAALIGLGALFISGCGEMDGIETKSSKYLSQWTGWFSEEQVPPYYDEQDCGGDPAVITAAACSGSYCDSMRLYCGPMPAGFTPKAGNHWGSGWFSEENPGQLCPQGFVAEGLRASGSYSDNLQLFCKPVNFPPQGVNCKWMPYFSEEQGTQYFDYDPYKYGPAVALGVICAGSYCDSMSFYVCEPKCTSHADCFSACNFTTGLCIVG